MLEIFQMMGWGSTMWVLMGLIMGICVLVVIVLYYLFARRSHFNKFNNKMQTHNVQKSVDNNIIEEVKHAESYFCPNCGEKLDEKTLKYCPYCGSEI